MLNSLRDTNGRGDIVSDPIFSTIPLRPRRGPKPRKGARLPALQDRVAEAQQSGEEMELYWYGGETRRVRLRGMEVLLMK